MSRKLVFIVGLYLYFATGWQYGLLREEIWDKNVACLYELADNREVVDRRYEITLNKGVVVYDRRAFFSFFPNTTDHWKTKDSEGCSQMDSFSVPIISYAKKSGHRSFYLICVSIGWPLVVVWNIFIAIIVGEFGVIPVFFHFVSLLLSFANALWQVASALIAPFFPV